LLWVAEVEVEQAEPVVEVVAVLERLLDFL
jgi:hypothetical protein